MKNQILKLECIDITDEGYGVCKDSGLVIFVREMLVGEVANVKIIKEKKNYCFGIIDELLISSPYRVNSSCPIASKCGGCDLRHLEYRKQCELKESLLKDYLKKENLDIEVKPIIKADITDKYRNKVQIPVKDHHFGYYRNHSNDIVELDYCLSQSDNINQIYAYLKEELLLNNLDTNLRHLLFRENKKGEVMLVYIASKDISKELENLNEKLLNKFPQIISIILNINKRNDNVILGKEAILLKGQNYLQDELNGLTFQMNYNSFYQINALQAEKLYQKVKELANIDKNTKALDLYCGIGTITLSLADQVKEIIGVEIIPQAIDNAKINAKLNNIDNVKFYCDDAAKDYQKYLKDIDLLIVDPPRKGISVDLINYLNNSNVSQIIYVSCNYKTLIRDLKLLQESYSFDCIYPLDMFPNTLHIENIVLLSKI